MSNLVYIYLNLKLQKEYYMTKIIKLFIPLILFVFVNSVNASTIKWSMPGDSLTLDPHAQNEGPTHMVSRQVYEGLVTRAIDMSIKPQLATSWKTVDPETWIFSLRKCPLHSIHRFDSS